VDRVTTPTVSASHGAPKFFSFASPDRSWLLGRAIACARGCFAVPLLVFCAATWHHPPQLIESQIHIESDILWLFLCTRRYGASMLDGKTKEFTDKFGTLVNTGQLKVCPLFQVPNVTLQAYYYFFEFSGWFVRASSPSTTQYAKLCDCNIGLSTYLAAVLQHENFPPVPDFYACCRFCAVPLANLLVNRPTCQPHHPSPTCAAIGYLHVCSRPKFTHFLARLLILERRPIFKSTPRTC
jgi:hypothetical protein